MYINNNVQEVGVISALAGIWTVMTYYAGNITPLFYLMLIFGIVDYLMGMAAAKWYPSTPEEGWSKELAVKGFVQKIACIFLIGVAWGIDFMILEADKAFNLPMEWGPFFGIFALCYMILTEGISILESAEKMGIYIPFLTSALKSFREKVSKGPVVKKED